MGQIRAVLGWVLPILAIALGVGVAARSSNLPTEDFWTESQWITTALFWMTVIVLIYQAIKDRVLIKRLERRKKDEYAQQIAQLLWYLVFQAAGERIPMTDLAVHVWRPKRHVPSIWHQQLEKVGSFQLHQRTSISITWVKGKGVVGQCWEQNRDRWFNLEPIQEAIAAGNLGDLPNDQRLGMTDDEIMRGDAYWAIYATPLKDEHGNCFGIVSIDSSKRDSFEDLRSATRGNLDVDGAVRVIEKGFR